MSIAPTIDVVMATLNGAAYLPAQLDSIAAQTMVPRRIWVRDDGSIDATPLILRRWADQAGNLRLLPGSSGRLGVNASYHTLLRRAAGEGASDTYRAADFLAFSDQDDVWLPGKLERAVGTLQALGEPAEVPALYCSAAIVTDRDLNPSGETPHWPHPPSLANALVENVALGCTVVLNRAAVQLLARDWPAQAVIAHDWWCYLAVAACGGVMVFDPEPGLHYRQHGKNAIGQAGSRLGQWSRRLSRLRHGAALPPVFAQAQGMLMSFDDRLSGEARAVLMQFLRAREGLGPRLMAALAPVARRQRWADDLLFRLMLLGGALG